MARVWKKAKRLVKEGKVKPEGNGWFRVEGDTHTYKVRVKDSKVSCDCEYYALHGTTKGRLCSHIMAVILYKYLEDIQSDLNQTLFQGLNKRFI